MANGKVKWFDAAKGFGFIISEPDGSEVFVHINEVEKAGLQVLHKGQLLQFQTIDGRNGFDAAVGLEVVAE